MKAPKAIGGMLEPAVTKTQVFLTLPKQSLDLASNRVELDVSSFTGPFIPFPISDYRGAEYPVSEITDMIKEAHYGGVWKWDYRNISGNKPTEKEFALAEKISRLAVSLREFGLASVRQVNVAQDTSGGPKKKHWTDIFSGPRSDEIKPYDLSSMSIMESLLNLFAGALMTRQGDEELAHYSTMIDDLENDFLRRVVTKRSRKRMVKPVSYTIGTMMLALVIGGIAPMVSEKLPSFGQPTLEKLILPEAEEDNESNAGLQPQAEPDAEIGEGGEPLSPKANLEQTGPVEDEKSKSGPSQTALLQALCFILAGVLMGRLLFFALTHSGRIETIEEYWRLEPQLNAPGLTLIFDIALGISVFVIFQTGFLSITIGGNQGIRSLDIADSGLEAFVFGILSGLARVAFLARVKKMSDETVKAPG